MAETRRDPYVAPEEKKKSSDSDIEKIKAEIEALAKKGELTPEAYSKLYKKYGDKESIVDEQLRHTTKHYGKRKRQARELASKAYKKFSSGKKPFHEILDMMMKYKIENKWSDAEYDEFRKELSMLLSGNRAFEIDYNQNIASYRSRINKALGSPRFLLP